MKTKLFLSLSLLTMAFTAKPDLALPVYGPHLDISQREFASAEALKQTVLDHKFKNNMIKTFRTVLPVAKLAGIGLVGGGAYALAYKLNHDENTVTAEQTRLANRSYVDMFKDSASTFGTKVSKLAQSAKANTWDTNAGFKHSGKVATIAGVAAVVGLSYLAKQKLFGKAVVKTTVAPEVTVVNNKRNRIS